MENDRRIVLTVGELDGLTIRPIVDASGGLVSIDLTVDTLPGMRLVLSADAVRELSYAFERVRIEHG